MTVIPFKKKKQLFKTSFCYGVRVTCKMKQQLHRWEDRSWKVGNDGNWRWGAGSVIPTLSMVREPDSSALCTSSSGAYPSGRGAVPPVAAPALSAQGWPRLPPPAGRTLTPTAGRRSCCARSLSKQREIVGYSRGLDVTHSAEGCWLLLFFSAIWTDEFKRIFEECTYACCLVTTAAGKGKRLLTTTQITQVTHIKCIFTGHLCWDYPTTVLLCEWLLQ